MILDRFLGYTADTSTALDERALVSLDGFQELAALKLVALHFFLSTSFQAQKCFQNVYR